MGRRQEEGRKKVTGCYIGGNRAVNAVVGKDGLERGWRGVGGGRVKWLIYCMLQRWKNRALFGAEM